MRTTGAIGLAVAILLAAVAGAFAPAAAAATPATPRAAIAHARTSDEDPVRWDAGSGRTAMARGLPSPPGWYAAALGRRTQDRVLYLTFDDGPFRANTQRLLDLLADNDARATFFLVGGAAAAQPRLVRRIARAGHAIGNHTYRHPRLTDLSRAEVRDQLRRTTKAIGRVQGPCMRPPYGLVDSRVAAVALDEGLQPILWTAHIEDWRRHGVAWHVSRLRRATEPGAIILLHDRNPRTISAVARMLPEWRAGGWRLESLPPCRVP